MSQAQPGDVTRLLKDWSCGSQEALNELVPLVYRELRGLAAAYLRRERRDHTLQPTALVHEAYLRLADQTEVDCRNRAHFFGIAANLMRQILVNHAKRHGAAKRAGGIRVTLEEAVGVAPPQVADMIALDDALQSLTLLDPRQGRIVELRFFGGLTEEEIAEIVGVSPFTVRRDWRIARAVLYNELHTPLLDTERRV
jgi:RNA polymerase sigma-70 factor (ECF subfamily)